MFFVQSTFNMSENEIDLDDVEIVNVTGRAHHDRPRKHDEGNCACKQSIRVTTIIIFICLLLVYGLLLFPFLFRISHP